ncbi:MAG: hypothetical protein Q9209_004712, partial [Squamulea sp. 1 TL-2023]
MSDSDLQQRRPERPTLPRAQEHDDPTRAYVRLHTGRNGNGHWEAAIASLDSGTEEQWVSGTFLKRANYFELEEENLGGTETYTAFNGEQYKATRGVVFSWHSEKSRQTRKGVFRVVENGPFDVIIGSKLLFQEGIYIFKPDALLFFHCKATEGEERRMQATLALQDTEVHQYNVQESAAQASARQRQRADLESGRPSPTSYTHGYGTTTADSTGRETRYPTVPSGGTNLHLNLQSGSGSVYNNPAYGSQLQSNYPYPSTSRAPVTGSYTQPGTSLNGYRDEKSYLDGSGQRRELHPSMVATSPYDTGPRQGMNHIALP